MRADGFRGSFEVIVRIAFFGPVVVAINVALMLQDAFGATDAAQLFVYLKSVLFGPDSVIVCTSRLTKPLFFTVTVFVVLGVVKFRDVGVTEITGATIAG
jgi:hypothetical protein